MVDGTTATTGDLAESTGGTNDIAIAEADTVVCKTD